MPPQPSKPQPPNNSQGIEAEMIKEIKSLNHLQEYPIRKLVEHTQDFGYFLKDMGLKTNQIRKFLDSMNRIKDKLVALETDEIIQAMTEDEQLETKFEKIKPDIVFLEPKLYYAAREREGEPFKNVISEAILKVKNIADFKRLVELIESIVAYHTYRKRGRN